MQDETLTALRWLRVLLVEDEPLVSMILADELERVHASVLGPVSSAKQALGLVGEGQPQAAILDVVLQGGPDFSVADRLLEQGVPFIFATGLDSSGMPERFADVPNCPKPAPAPEVLATLVRRVLAIN